MNDPRNWGILMIVWVALMAPPFFYLGYRESQEKYDGPSTSQLTRLGTIWMIGFFSLFLLRGAGIDLIYGILWSVIYFAAVVWWRFRERLARSPKTAIRLIFVGAAGFIICSLMSLELSNYVYALEGRPLSGGIHELFDGPLLQVVFALIALFGGYLLFSQRIAPK